MTRINLQHLDPDRRKEVERLLGADTGANDMRKRPEHTAMERRQKYNAQPTEVDDLRFDSKVEARRYQQLQIMERAGEISELSIKPLYILQPSFTDAFGKTHRAITYTADFAYMRNGQAVTEDVKGGKATQDAAFSIRWKLAIKRYPTIKFELVEM